VPVVRHFLLADLGRIELRAGSPIRCRSRAARLRAAVGLQIVVPTIENGELISRLYMQGALHS